MHAPKKCDQDPDRQSIPKTLSSSPSSWLSSSLPVDELRRVATAELLSSVIENNHFYVSTLTNYGVIDNVYPGTSTALNRVQQGTGWNQRLGDSIRMRRLRFSGHYRPFQNPDVVDPGTGVPAYTNYSGTLRLAIVLDKMPIVGNPAPIDQFSYGTNPPSSASALWALPSAVPAVAGNCNAGDVPILVRNPQTFQRFHVLREVLLCPSGGHGNYSTYNNVSTVTTAYRGSSVYFDFDIPLHDMVVPWYDQANSGAILTNGLWLVMIADTPPNASAPGQTGFIKYCSDLEYYSPS